MVRRLDDRLEFGVDLVRSDGPIRIFGVPTCDACIVKGGIEQGEDARRARRVAGLTIFKKQSGRVLISVIEVAQSPHGDFPE